MYIYGVTHFVVFIRLIFHYLLKTKRFSLYYYYRTLRRYVIELSGYFQSRWLKAIYLKGNLFVNKNLNFSKSNSSYVHLCASVTLGNQNVIPATCRLQFEVKCYIRVFVRSLPFQVLLTYLVTSLLLMHLSPVRCCWLFYPSILLPRHILPLIATYMPLRHTQQSFCLAL